MNSTKKQELKYNKQHTMIVKSRNGVIIMNRIILLASISIALVFIFKRNWISVLLVFAISYILSIINSVRASYRVKNITGLSHAEQSEIWSELKADYESFSKN